MSHADVAECVSAIVPCCHMEWPNDSAPALPWACYYGKDRPVCADDGQAAVLRKWTVELYEKRRDAELEKALAESLRSRFGFVNREESYIENDNMLMVVFTFNQIEGEYDG